jgi:ribosomal protein S18 acetylase RimI-like enzyme
MSLIYRRLNFSCPLEVRYIADVDTLIPLMFEPDFNRPEQMLLDRVESLSKMLEDDFAEVAEGPGAQIVGFHIIKKGSFFGRVVGNVSTLWVDPQFRQQGIARTLKERAEVWAQKEKLYCLYSSTFATNEPMLKLNSKMGFEIVSHRLQKKIHSK